MFSRLFGRGVTNPPAMPLDKCDIPGCTSNSIKSPGMGFFKMNSRAKREKRWLASIQRLCGPQTGRLNTICENHFEQRYIYTETRNNTTFKRLYIDAVPTLFPVTVGSEPELTQSNESIPPDELVVADDLSEAARASTSTSTYVSDTFSKRQLIEDEETTYHKRMKSLKVQAEDQRISIDISDDDDEDNEILLIKENDSMSEFKNLPSFKEKLKEQIYTTTVKMVAMQLYSKFPNYYHLFYRSMHLPPIPTLCRLYIPRKTQLSFEVLKALKLNVDKMTHAEKQCAICINTMSLTPNIGYDDKTGKLTGLYEVNNIRKLRPANTALVVMVRGIFHLWKQAIAFAFLTSDQDCSHVKPLINKIIIDLFQIGLNVRVVMTDIESDFNIVPEILKGISIVTYPAMKVNNKKVYYMYDPLYLMKDIRDALVKRNFIFHKGFVANWTYLAECYQQDHKKGRLRIAPKLSFNHVHPSSNNVDEIKIISEVFTERTGKAMTAYIQKKILPEAAKGTVLWIFLINKLMEMLNFSTLNPPDNTSSMFIGEQYQIKFLQDTVSIFHELRVTSEDKSTIDEDATKNVKFIDAFKMTMTTMLTLYRDLISENCWHPTIGLTRDCLTKFFIEARKKYNPYPTVDQFTACIKMFPIDNIFQYNVKNTSDHEVFLSPVRQVSDENMFDDKRLEIDFEDQCSDVVKEFSAVNMTVVSKLDHMALYLLHKGYEQHSGCRHMENFVYGNDDLERNSLVFHYITADGRAIDTVAAEFSNFIKALEIKFKSNFVVNGIPPSMSQLIQSIKSVVFKIPCKCFPLEYIKQLYLRFRLYLLLKYNNDLLKSGGRTVFGMNHLCTHSPLLVCNFCSREIRE